MTYLQLIQTIHNLNVTIFYLINNTFNNELLNSIFPYLTNLGSLGIVIIICTILYFINGDKGKRIALLGIISVALVSIIVFILKPMIGELRPFLVLPHVNLLTHETGIYSFPSGHTSLAFAIATVLGISYKFQLQNKTIKLIYITLPIAALIGFSRIYLGVHYPLDIIGGAIVGISSGLIVLKAKKYIFSNKYMKKLILLHNKHIRTSNIGI